MNRREFIGAGLTGLGALAASAQEARGFVVHEWGVLCLEDGAEVIRTRGPHHAQHGDDLPPFVHVWEDVTRQEISDFWRVQIGCSKKPVVYFYADRRMDVSFAVSIPTGRPYAWFPSATAWGPRPSRPAPQPAAPTDDLREEIYDAVAARNGFIEWKDLTRRGRN